jgi:hypothetical protein
VLEVADARERATQAEALLRAFQPVAFDVTKPLAERTLPSDLVAGLVADGIPVKIDGAAFPAVFELTNKTIDAAISMRNCAFASFAATHATFNAPVDMSGSSFGDLQLGYGQILEATLQRVLVSGMCWLAYAHVKGFLDVSGSVIETLVLVGAEVEGEIAAIGATVSALVAQGLSVQLNVMAMGTHFKGQVVLDHADVRGAVQLSGAVFDARFSPSRVKIKGTFDLDGAQFKSGVAIDELACATFSMSRSTVTGDAALFDLEAGNVLLAATEFAGALRFERGCVRGVFDVRRITVAGDFVIERTELQGGTDLAGVEAASLQLLDVTCADIYAYYPIELALSDAGVTDVSRSSRFGWVSVLRSNLTSLRPARWEVAGEMRVSSSTIGYGLIEHDRFGSFVVADTKLTEAFFVGQTSFGGDVRFINVAAGGPVVFQGNDIPDRLDVRLSTFGRLDFQRQRLPRTLNCTSSTANQLMFDGMTRRHALSKEERNRYDGSVIDLESSTYEQIFCSVSELTRHLAPKPSRQQFVVLERALRASGFDELGDMVYRDGRTRYYNRLRSTDLGVWSRGMIADWTTGYGLSVTRITLLTVIVPLVLFALVLLSPGTATEAAAPSTCAASPAWTTAAAAIGATYLGEGTTTAHLTECRLLGTIPAHALALPLRLLGLILVPLWLAIATGILKYAVKSGA